MISLEENRTSLINLPSTIKALEDLDKLIVEYSKDLPGPAYTVFDVDRTKPIKVQFQRSIVLTALWKRREVLVEYLSTLGIDVNAMPA